MRCLEGIALGAPGLCQHFDHRREDAHQIRDLSCGRLISTFEAFARFGEEARTNISTAASDWRCFEIEQLSYERSASATQPVIRREGRLARPLLHAPTDETATLRLVR
jgi:hypothetical protein